MSDDEVRAALRATDATLGCKACRHQQHFPGPMRPIDIDAWSAQHTQPVMLSWSITAAGHLAGETTQVMPPPVIER